MNIKTVQQVIAENASYKPSSLYAAILKAIKSGGLSGKAIPINRNDANAKFRLPATNRKTRRGGREVTNFVLLDLAAFDAWFEAGKAGIRTTIALHRTQVVMPRLEEIVAGKYTSKQLSELATHVANRRYGSKTRKAKAPSDGQATRGRPRKTVAVAKPIKAATPPATTKPKTTKPVTAKPARQKPIAAQSVAASKPSKTRKP